MVVSRSQVNQLRCWRLAVGLGLDVSTNLIKPANKPLNRMTNVANA